MDLDKFKAINDLREIQKKLDTLHGKLRHAKVAPSEYSRKQLNEYAVKIYELKQERKNLYETYDLNWYDVHNKK